MHRSPVGVQEMHPVFRGPRDYTLCRFESSYKINFNPRLQALQGVRSGAFAPVGHLAPILLGSGRFQGLTPGGLRGVQALCGVAPDRSGEFLIRLPIDLGIRIAPWRSHRKLFSILSYGCFLKGIAGLVV